MKINFKKIFSNQALSKTQYKRYTRTKLGNFFYFAFLIVAGLFSILPMVYCIATSFKPLSELLIFPPRFIVHDPTFENYTAIPTLLTKLNVPISRYVFNSIFIAVINTFLQVMIGSMAAFALAKSHIKGKNVIFFIIQFSMLYNAYTLAIPHYIITTKLGIIDTYLAYILPSLASSMSCFLMRQYMEGSVPDTLLEAARIDGATVDRIYWQIILPLVKPCLMTLVLFSFQGMWSLVPSGTIFSEELKTLPYVLGQIVAGGIARAGSSMAVTVIMMIPPIIVYFITQSNVFETMSSAGIKE